MGFRLNGLKSRIKENVRFFIFSVQWQFGHVISLHRNSKFLFRSKWWFFFALNHLCYNCFLYFDCLWKHVQKTKPLYKYLELAEELRKLVIVAKKKIMNFLSLLLIRNKIGLDVTKKSLLRLPFVTRVLQVAQGFFKSKNLKSHYFRVTRLFSLWKSIILLPNFKLWYHKRASADTRFLNDLSKFALNAFRAIAFPPLFNDIWPKSRFCLIFLPLASL